MGLGFAEWFWALWDESGPCRMDLGYVEWVCGLWNERGSFFKHYWVLILEWVQALLNGSRLSGMDLGALRNEKRKT